MRNLWETEEKQLEKYNENQGVAISYERVEERLTSCRGWSTVSEAMEEKFLEIRKILIILQFSWNLRRTRRVFIIDQEKKLYVALFVTLQSSGS